MKQWLLFCAACLLALSGCTSGQSQTPPPTGSASAEPATTAPPPSSTPVPTPRPTSSVVPTAFSPAPSDAVVSPPARPSAPEPSLPQPAETLPSEIPVPLESPPASEEILWNGDPDALTLDDFPTQLSSSSELAEAIEALPEDGAGLYLLSQLPEQDTWLYGVYGPNKAQGLILRIGENWKYLDISYLTPQMLPPVMAYGDYDQDLDMELAIVTHLGSGSDVNQWGLSVVEVSTDEGWTDLEFAPTDYRAILEQSVSITYEGDSNRITLKAGESALELALTELGITDPGEPVTIGTGGVVLFTAEEDSLYATFTMSIESPGIPTGTFPNLVQVDTDVIYTGSAFGLNNFSLSLSEF